MNKYGIKNENIPFSELLEIISNELMKQTLSNSVRLAEKHGLAKMTLKEISKEVKAVRKNAESHN